MTYNEVASGGSLVGGCAEPSVRRQFVTKFGPGDIVYNLRKAQRGVLEEIAIKKTRIAPTAATFGMAVALYVDTFNGLWNERDLVDAATAAALVAAFFAPDPSIIGGLIINGTATVTLRRPSRTLYSIAKARKGILEKVVVKDVRTSFQGTVLYVDTFNGLWNSRELTDYVTAIALAADYLNLTIEQVEAMATCPR